MSIKPLLVVKSNSDGSFEGQLTSPTGRIANFRGNLTSGQFSMKGSRTLARNASVRDAISQIAHYKYIKRRTRDQGRKALYEHRLDFYESQLEVLATLLDANSVVRIKRWCSACNTHAYHQEVDAEYAPRSCFICEACGWPTQSCDNDGCKNMACHDDLLDVGRWKLCSDCQGVLYPFSRAHMRPQNIGKAYEQSASRISEFRDEAFELKKLVDGSGPTVIFALGMRSARKNGEGILRLIQDTHPEAEVFRLHWNAGKSPMNLEALSLMPGIGRVARAGAILSKPVRAGYDFIRSRPRSMEAGRILGELIAQTKSRSLVLVGHSLGAQLMVTAAETCAEFGRYDAISEVHLLGAAMRSTDDFLLLSESVDGLVYNYHSINDPDLYLLYGPYVGTAGANGIDTLLLNVKNVDLSDSVFAHSGEAYAWGIERLRP
jgi:Protein of unknown function (DUF726)